MKKTGGRKFRDTLPLNTLFTSLCWYSVLTPNIDKIRAELPIFLTGVIKVYGREGVPDIFQVKENSYHVDKLRIKSKKKLILFFK